MFSYVLFSTISRNYEHINGNSIHRVNRKHISVDRCSLGKKKTRRYVVHDLGQCKDSIQINFFFFVF